MFLLQLLDAFSLLLQLHVTAFMLLTQGFKLLIQGAPPFSGLQDFLLQISYLYFFIAACLLKLGNPALFFLKLSLQQLQFFIRALHQSGRLLPE